MFGDDPEKLSLRNLLDGAAIERFDDELKRVIENCLDPNTGAGARTITLALKIKPTEDRSRSDVTLTCQSKIVPAIGVQSLIYLGMARGEAVAYEYNPEQFKLNLNKHTPVVGIAGSDTKE